MTTEELLREAIAERLEADAAISAAEIPVITRKKGDIASMIEEAIASIGAALVVTTPIPSKATGRRDKLQFLEYTAGVLVVVNPTLATDKPSESALSALVEDAIHNFSPPSLKEGAAGKPWVLRINDDTPREDLTDPADLVIRHLSRFTYSSNQ